MEPAGYLPSTTHAWIGLYAGVSYHHYYLEPRLEELVASVGRYRLFTLSDKDFITTRTTYRLNLTGPTMTIQTACSTSLVAVYVASQRPLIGVVLVSPYDSMRNIAQDIYFYVPVSLLLKHHFDALALAPAIKIPMLALIAEPDHIIPPKHAFALIEAWGGVTQQKIIPNTNHNDIQLEEGYWESITAFLNSILK